MWVGFNLQNPAHQHLMVCPSVFVRCPSDDAGLFPGVWVLYLPAFWSQGGNNAEGQQSLSELLLVLLIFSMHIHLTYT